MTHRRRSSSAACKTPQRTLTVPPTGCFAFCTQIEFDWPFRVRPVLQPRLAERLPSTSFGTTRRLPSPATGWLSRTTPSSTRSPSDSRRPRRHCPAIRTASVHWTTVRTPSKSETPGRPQQRPKPPTKTRRSPRIYWIESFIGRRAAAGAQCSNRPIACSRCIVQ